MEKIGIYGAGIYGKLALEEKGKERVCAFIDNNYKLWGKNIEGVTIVGGIEKFIEKYPDAKVLIAIKEFADVCEELEKMQIKYEVYFPVKIWFGNQDKLLVNPYENRKMQLKEKDIPSGVDEKRVQELGNHVRYLNRQKPLFNHIEIETYNRCNGGCDFCPVSVKNETRKECLMQEEVFEKIISELADLEYSGCIALFSNNEPFLDNRMTDFCRQVRKKLPKAKTHLFTNGTVLTLSKFKEVIDDLDELIIDNYNISLQLIKNVKEIYEFCQGNSLLEKKVTIVLRNPQEILESRGGYAPNKERKALMKEIKCTHPFRQLIIRPDGEVSICCNDALGITSMGNVANDSLVNIWYGKEFERVREAIEKKGRGGVEFCQYCDSLRLV